MTENNGDFSVGCAVELGGRSGVITQIFTPPGQSWPMYKIRFHDGHVTVLTKLDIVKQSG